MSKRNVKPLVLHTADIENMPPESFPDPRTGGIVSWKTLISSDKTATDTFTTDIATCPPSTSTSCPGHLKLHRYTHVEIYHVTASKGVMSIDGKEHEVEKGSVVFIPEDAEHRIRNTGSEELVWLYVFAADGFGDVVYRFSEEEAGKGRAKL
jgi:mannose-6-phosphate isomerase-like protein (cupin superfamily)